MSQKPKERTAVETKRCRDQVLRVMLSTPPKPRKSMTPKRSEAQRKKTKSARRSS